MSTAPSRLSRPMLHLSLCLGFLLAAAPLFGADRCSYASTSPGERRLGDWIHADNWLHAGSRRATLTAASTFMPATKMTAATANSRPLPAGRMLEIERFPAIDPADGSRRDLAFLLHSRLNADALIVLMNGQRIAERYWHGTPAQAPRLLLSGTRPVLSLLGAMAISQGMLAADKSIARPIAPLADSIALRKLSTRRLLDGGDGYGWGAADIADWQRAGGWMPAPGDGVRAWLTRYDTWTALSPNAGLPPAEGRPEDELLAWAIAEASGSSPARLFCEQIFSHLKPEDPALWLTDPAGHALAAGLALSPRDHARLGQLLLDTRPGGKRGRIPDWLTEALIAPATGAGDPGLAGLPAGSTLRYSFVRLGGKGTRIALIGPYGTSLFIDFDRRLVIVMHASHPDADSALLRATINEAWGAIISAIPANRR